LLLKGFECGVDALRKAVWTADCPAGQYDTIVSVLPMPRAKDRIRAKGGDERMIGGVVAENPGELIQGGLTKTRRGLQRVGHEKEGGTMKDAFGASPRVVVVAERDAKAANGSRFGKSVCLSKNCGVCGFAQVG